MQSKAAIAGHPLHPIFVIIPIGLWCFTPVCDLIYHLGWGDDSWKRAAFYCLTGGTIATVPAFITGLIDYGLCQDPGAARTAKFHLICNIVTTLIMIVSVVTRYREVTSPPNDGGMSMPLAHPYSLLPVGISFVGVLLAGISGWLGGELVSRFGISVHESALERGASGSSEFRKS